jgi:hypothetical protein
LPLEAVSDYFSIAAAATYQRTALLGNNRPVGMVYVTSDFFQTSPNGITSDGVKADVLGFFSLIMTYAKGARAFNVDESPKVIGSLMPRTDFTNVFNQVRANVPGTLYDIVKVLSCYNYDPASGGVT